MKHILCLFLILTLFVKSYGGDSVPVNSYHKYHFVYGIHNTNLIYLDKDRIQRRFEIVRYKSPLYVYRNEVRLSITQDVKFWIDYNDFALLTNAYQGRINKYHPKVSCTFRVKLPWK